MTARELAVLFWDARFMARAARKVEAKWRELGCPAGARTARLQAAHWEHLAAQARDRILSLGRVEK